MPLPNPESVGLAECPASYITRTVDCSAGVTDQAVDLGDAHRVTGVAVTNVSGPVSLKFGGTDMEENPLAVGFYPVSLLAEHGLFLNCAATANATVTLVIGVR